MIDLHSDTLASMKLCLFACLWGLSACFPQTTSFDFAPLSLQVFPYFGGGFYQHAANSTQSNDLLEAFRMHYHRFEHAITDTLQNPTDCTVLARLGDDLDEFTNMVIEVSHQTNRKKSVN